MKVIYILFFVSLTMTLNGQNGDSISIQQIDSLISVCRELASKNAFEKAMEIIGVAEKLSIERFGKLSATYGSCCFNKGRIYYLQSNLSEAEKWYIEAKDIRASTIGKNHPDYAWSLNNLGSLYKDQGKFIDAEKYYIESKTIRENYFGNQHPDYVNSLNNLGILYWQTGQYSKAEQVWTECKIIREQTLGKDHPDYAWSLFNLAVLFRDQGNYIPAESLTLQCIAIQEKNVGKIHPSYAAAINGLALLYYLMGKYERAEPLYKASLEIREKTVGKENAEYAWSLNNLANLYVALCEYDRAEILMIECKKIREKVLGKQHSDFAASLNNLGILYISMGRFTKAEEQFLECKSLREQYEGKLHPEYANVLTNLASLYKSIRKYEQSESLLLETIEIRKKVLGTDHPDYAISLFNLGDLYKSNGNFEKAMALIFECTRIWKEKLGNQHPTYATGILNLADLHLAIAQFDNAENLYKEAKIIFEKVIGKEHLSYGLNIINLAELYEKLMRYSESEQLLKEHFSLQQKQLLNGISYLSENELTSYLAILKDKDNKVSSMMFRRNSDIHQNHPSVMAALIYDQTLFYKGFVLSSVARLKKLSKMTLEANEISDLLKSKQRLLAKEYSKPILERNKVNSLEEEANTLEKELSRTIAGYTETKQLVTWNEVQAALKPGELALEFVSFKINFPESTDSTFYAALIIKHGDNQPLFIPLFEEKSLDSLLNSKSERKADYVNSLYTLADRGAVALENPKKSLYEILWKPLEKELAGIKTIYFSPSGLLLRINLDAIPISETETLADKYQLIELNSTRQLVIPTQIKNGNNDAILYGGIQFEQDSIISNNEPLVASRSRGLLSFNYVDSTLRGGTWNYLAGTEREVNTIEKMMLTSGIQTKLKKGYEASEDSFKNIGANNNPSPRILHIATHGYFFVDPKEGHQSSVISRQEEPVFKISEHPMLRSGLIMAGGNAAWQGKQTLEGREDGILTAYEISQMNLSNTELIVLSACETGLGDIQGNEGVYGLQRAFKIAGVKYLIMSLWQVPDKQTSLLMTTFYKKWLEDKMTIPDAFHAAQKQLRDNGLDPYNWAGFVLVE
ncbi:MAG: tetratricopeptide repeat protein [Saprospiraceae bacterium]|jgi:CHAT domain-containing protein|nr:tetratricopeptide repeat protein [Saprospiraceae bacterium]